MHTSEPASWPCPAPLHSMLYLLPLNAASHSASRQLLPSGQRCGACCRGTCCSLALCLMFRQVGWWRGSLSVMRPSITCCWAAGADGGLLSHGLEQCTVFCQLFRIVWVESTCSNCLPDVGAASSEAEQRRRTPVRWRAGGSSFAGMPRSFGRIVRTAHPQHTGNVGHAGHRSMLRMNGI